MVVKKLPTLYIITYNVFVINPVTTNAEFNGESSELSSRKVDTSLELKTFIIM